MFWWIRIQVCRRRSFLSWQLLGRLMQCELGRMMPARKCLTFCVQTLVHTPPIKRLIHLVTGLPVPCLLHSMAAGAKNGFIGLQILLEKPKLAKSHDVWQKLPLLEIALHSFANAYPQFSETALPLCLHGASKDFKPQLQKLFSFNEHLSSRPFCLSCERTWLGTT